MRIDYDLALQSRVVSAGQTNMTHPVLIYGTSPVWEICLTENGEIPDLSGITAWRAAADGDFNKDTVPVCRSYGENIDTSGIADGVIRVRLFARTAEFLTALNGKKERSGYFELQGINESGYAELVVQVKIWLHAAVDPGDIAGTDPLVLEEYVRQTQVEAMLARKLEYEYSVDGVESHSTMTEGDRFFRIRHGESGTPSDWQKIPYGPAGAPGEKGEPGDFTGQKIVAELEDRIDALEQAVGTVAENMSSIIGEE